MKAVVLSWSAVVLLGYSVAPAVFADEAAAPGTRTFRLDYRFTIKGIERGARVRLWVPVPQSSQWQSVESLPADLPARPTFHTEPKFCNQILYCQFTAGGSQPVTINLPYRIARRRVPAPAEIEEEREQDGCGTDRDLFLKPDALVPIAGRPLELFDGRLPIGTVRQRARSIYDLVRAHVTYDKSGTGWGRGDVLWVCDNGRGNCSDFHSLFISLARSQSIPAKFEIGFPLPADKQGAIAGYHCWAWFQTEQGHWLPVDISEADKFPERKEFYFGRLTADRVAFSVARDIDLVPRQNGPPLNFFIYPRVEVDGQPLATDALELLIGYRDLGTGESDGPVVAP